jgi:hypothetical protein
MGLAPLLFVNVSAQFDGRVATDASDQGQGVVVCDVSSDVVTSVVSECGGSAISLPVVDSDDQLQPNVDLGLVQFVRECDWRVVVSSRWRAPEHINSLEFRAVSTAIRWSCISRLEHFWFSFPSL